MARVTKTTVVEDVDQTQRVVRPRTSKSEEKVRTYSAVDQFIYLIFGTINVLLLIRFLFRLTAANPNSLVVAFIYDITEIFMVPFRFIFSNSAVERSVFGWSVLVAIIFYSLISWVVTQIIAIVYTADTG